MVAIDRSTKILDGAPLSTYEQYILMMPTYHYSIFGTTAAYVWLRGNVRNFKHILTSYWADHYVFEFGVRHAFNPASHSYKVQLLRCMIELHWGMHRWHLSPPKDARWTEQRSKCKDQLMPNHTARMGDWPNPSVAVTTCSIGCRLNKIQTFQSGQFDHDPTSPD